MLPVFIGMAIFFNVKSQLIFFALLILILHDLNIIRENEFCKMISNLFRH